MKTKMSEPNIRELQKEDLWNGFLTTVDSLRQASNIDINKAEKIFDKINSNPDHIVVVAELDGRIVGTTTLLIEPKFIHNGGGVGHIEDVAIDKKFQRQKIGTKIITYVLEIAKSKGCYKTILNCANDVKPFYEKLEFKHVANELRFDYI